MQTVLTNATVVLPGETIHGTVLVRDGVIADIQPGRSGLAAALDLNSDVLMPGIIDLHTDNLERQVHPRQNARWPSRAAMVAHDSQCVAAGVTTVFDALCVGDLGFDEDRPRTCRDGIADLDALGPRGLLKADHYLHLRCELPAIGMPDDIGEWAAHPRLRMVSLMDHTPGFGQFHDLDRYCSLRRADEPAGATRERVAKLQAQRTRWRGPNRRALLDSLTGRSAVLASHDDATEAEIADNLADGIAVSEFPVTRCAAQAARVGGMGVIAGAPNLVRGGSHAGNVSVLALLRAGLVDVLASDYVPASLLHAAFLAAEQVRLGLPQAVGLITEAPARMVKLADRGRIKLGLRADLVRVRVHQDLPIVRAVWIAGERAA